MRVSGYGAPLPGIAHLPPFRLSVIFFERGRLALIGGLRPTPTRLYLEAAKPSLGGAPASEAPNAYLAYLQALPRFYAWPALKVEPLLLTHLALGAPLWGQRG